MTIPGERALKPDKPGRKPCKAGVTHRSAKKPYTTVGIPANTSRQGFTVRRTAGGAYSLRNSAIRTPAGTATNREIQVTSKVPRSSGRIPKLWAENKGVH
jgi:hypothetical protein